MYRWCLNSSARVPPTTRTSPAVRVVADFLSAASEPRPLHFPVFPPFSSGHGTASILITLGVFRSLLAV